MAAFMDVEAGVSRQGTKRKRDGEEEKKGQGSYCRGWCLTSYQDEDLKDLFGANMDDVKYMVYQREICPDTKKEHWQGYVEFIKPKRLSALKKILSTAHWEPRKGSRDQARAYCMKDDSRKEGASTFEIGSFATNQGKRTDLHVCAEMIKGGKKLMDVANEFPSSFIRYFKGMQTLKSLVELEKMKKNQYTKVALLL